MGGRQDLAGLEEREDAGSTLRNKRGFVQHSGHVCERAEIDLDRLASQPPQPLRRLPEQFGVHCAGADMALPAVLI